MHATGNRFKIMNGENVRIMLSVPANRIKWMISIMIRPELSFLFDINEKIPLPVYGFKIFRRANITLAIRRVL